ncbi:MAG: glycosyltransferase, partial [Bifidobacteriaceae bacterium]|nr:glycosyltransferase [Bifidobacteriaceae bacterium]
IEPGRGEVIVSDFGSRDQSAAAPVEAAGGRYVYTSTDGLWSRSGALNAGFAVASGDVLITTDADMLFTPGSLNTVAEQVRQDRACAVVLQCRDLPKSHAHDRLTLEQLDWSELERVAKIRPRWGMGGMLAFPAEYYDKVRGFDERMHTYGGEDIDFANRLRRAGLRLEWLEHNAVRMYHMWHPPTRRQVQATAAGLAAVNANSLIMTSDPSVMRNLVGWRNARDRAKPLVSVVIATHNRAKMLAQAIETVRAQTFQDFEIIVVNDGCTDATAEMLDAIDDPRIVQLHQKRAGLAAARNRATDAARGQFIAVHDDDDLMVPWRLEASLAAFTSDVQATYGGWIDFNDSTGQCTVNPGRHHSLGALLYSPGVFLHPTLMIRTEVLRQFNYDTRFGGGSDFNLALRMTRSGVRMRHSGHIHVMRRLHPKQVTETARNVQSMAAWRTARLAESPMRPQLSQSLKEEQQSKASAKPHGRTNTAQWQALLPDHLCKRLLLVEAPLGLATEICGRKATSSIRPADRHDLPTWVCFDKANWRQAGSLASAGFPVFVLPQTGKTVPHALFARAFAWAAGLRQLPPHQTWLYASVSSDQIPDGLDSTPSCQHTLLVETANGLAYPVSLLGFNEQAQAETFAEQCNSAIGQQAAWLLEQARPLIPGLLPKRSPMRLGGLTAWQVSSAPDQQAK